jgi:hypothetical protein
MTRPLATAETGLPVPPVLVLAFNRPESTARVIAALRDVRPRTLCLAVDGPRAGRPDERERVLEVQRLADSVDWDCDVRTLFRPENLGCKLAVSQAIGWFFDQFEAGIVLEDDCVAHPSFFPYAAELLDRYRDDERVCMVSGDNFQFGRRRTSHSYYFSMHTHIWGWASWRRAWRLYDHRMTLWPELRDGGWLEDLLGDRAAAAYWRRIFDATHAERNTSWAYRWTFAAWANNGLTILPNVNLVSNIGFGDAATHTLRRRNRLAALPVAEMAFPLDHPPFMIRDAQADRFTQRRVFGTGAWPRRIVAALWRRLHGGMR